MNAIEFNNISKQYRLGQISTGTVSHDLNRWWAKFRGKEDPYLQIGEINDRSHKGTSDYVWALQDINFTVEQGDVVGIIGKNGAGKSTLLKILSKITAPTTGEIRARGRIASLLEVGTGFHPEMTGRENIYLNGAIMGMTRSEITRKLDEIVDFAGVERYLDTPVKRYSSGMMVRLGFAVAAHLEPEILIVDEVLAVGDAEFQKKAIGKMKEVSRGDGRTVLFVSHNMGAVRNLCKSGLVMHQGHIRFSGSSGEAVDFYMNETLPKDVSQSTLLLESGALYSDKIEITSITINGKETLALAFHDGDPLQLHVRITGQVKTRTRIEIEGRIYDTNEVPLAMFSPGHNRMNYRIYDPGIFVLEETIMLPASIHKGDYLMSLDISNPGVEYLYRIPDNIRIEASGFVSAVGAIFEYQNGNGFIQLLSSKA